MRKRATWWVVLAVGAVLVVLAACCQVEDGRVREAVGMTAMYAVGVVLFVWTAKGGRR